MSRQMLIAALAFCAVAVVAQETSSTNSETQAASVPRRVRVSGGVMIALVEHRTLPDYPEDAIKAGSKGDMIFKVIIDETGKIVRSEPLEGQPLLIAASMDALRDFRFRPYELDGTPFQVESLIGFHFDVRGKGNKAKGKVEYMSFGKGNRLRQ